MKLTKAKLNLDEKYLFIINRVLIIHIETSRSFSGSVTHVAIILVVSFIVSFYSN